MSAYNVRKRAPERIHAVLGEHPELIRDFLYYRGVESALEAETFLNPDYDAHTHDPFLLSDMDIAVTRILSAIQRKERIKVFSDYDADGIPGAVVMHDFFKKIGYADVSTYIPHRNTEGFGLNTDAIDRFAGENVKLVITVDCGMGDAEVIAHARARSIDVIVTDHHLAEAPAGAFAVVNPNKPGDPYPFKSLSGAAVAFKLVQALIMRGNFDIQKGWEKWLLDMVGIATLSDMVPLTDENRVFARYGLTVLRRSNRVGLRELLRRTRVQKPHLNEDDVTFVIAPRINAASRMDSPELAFELLTTDDRARAEALAETLDCINDERKGVVASMVKEIRKRLDARDALQSVIVIGDPSWRPGLLGLAASAVAERYRRPAFVWGRGESKEIKGSCRSDGVVNVAELMGRVSDLFTQSGGHHYSGGFAVAPDRVHMLEETLSKTLEQFRSDVVHEHETMIDSELDLIDVEWSMYHALERLAPFGSGNPRPTFLFKRVNVSRKRVFGKEGSHVELSFDLPSGRRVPAVRFYASRDGIAERVREGQVIDLIATMEKSVFRGEPELRLRIVEIT